VGSSSLRRHHLLRPDGKMRQIFLYCLAVCAKKHGVEVHVPVLMSTHEHLVVTDVHGTLPHFLRDLHRLVALATKVHRKWEGPVWDHEPTSCVALLTPQAIVEKMAYAIANPVAAGLVRYAREWPGVTAMPDQLGRRCWRVARPDVFLDGDNPQWPEHAELELTLPPELLEGHAPAEVRTLVAQELAALEREARAEVKRKAWRFLGADRCLNLSPYKRATSFEPLRDRNPTFAVGRGNREAYRAAVEARREFLRRYHAALDRWRAGERGVCFPPGAWWMCRFHGCASTPDPPRQAA
jgi:putative transposase